MSRHSDPVRFGAIKVRLPPAARGQRIGLLGGSFYPPHEAHKLITETALRRLGLDRVWWVVTPGNPLKSHGELAPLQERLALCRALVADPRVVVTAFEQDLPTAYTSATLAFLRGRLPGVRFVWLMGADNLAGLHRWQDWRGICRAMPVAVVDRPGWRLKSLSSPAGLWLRPFYLAEYKAKILPYLTPPRWVFLTGRLSRLSSSELRRRGKASPSRAP